MASAINATLANSNPIFLCVVVGGIISLGNLLPRIDFPLEVDYLHVTRYAGKTRGSEVQWITEPKKSLENRTIVVFDDILDAGVTIKAAIDYCHSHGAEKVYSAVLVDKQHMRA